MKCPVCENELKEYDERCYNYSGPLVKTIC